MFTYFNEDGSLRVLSESVFDEDGEIISDVFYQISQNFYSFPNDSDAIRLYYADLFASETHGNYTPETLYNRSL